MSDLMTNDSPQPTSATPLPSRQHADLSGTLPSGFMPQDIYPDVRTEHCTTDTAMTNSTEGIVATEPSTIDTVMTDDQPSSKLPQNIKDGSLTTKLATTDDELFAGFLVDNVVDFVSPVPSTLPKLPVVPYFQRSIHQQARSLEPAKVTRANDCVLVDPFSLENNRHSQDYFNKFLAKYPHLRSTSPQYVSARHQFWRACGGKAELAPSVGAAELYAWEAAPNSVPAPTPVTTASLKQARDMLSMPPDPRRGRPQIYSFNAENDAARHRTPATTYDAAAAAAAAGMMPPPPRPARPSNPAAHIPRPIFGNLDPILLPNSHIDDMRYNLHNTASEAKAVVARSLAVLDTAGYEAEGVRQWVAALSLCARLAVLRLEFPYAYLKETE